MGKSKKPRSKPAPQNKSSEFDMKAELRRAYREMAANKRSIDAGETFASQARRGPENRPRILLTQRVCPIQALCTDGSRCPGLLWTSILEAITSGGGSASFVPGGSTRPTGSKGSTGVLVPIGTLEVPRPDGSTEKIPLFFEAQCSAPGSGLGQAENLAGLSR